MSVERKPAVEVGKTDPEPVRTKDNPLGIDDIGLPAGIQNDQKDEVTRLNEIRPDPEKTKDNR